MELDNSVGSKFKESKYIFSVTLVNEFNGVKIDLRGINLLHMCDLESDTDVKEIGEDSVVEVSSLFQ